MQCRGRDGDKDLGNGMEEREGERKLTDPRPTEMESFNWLTDKKSN